MMINSFTNCSYLLHKRKSIIEAGAPINKTLRPDIEASKDWDTTGNLFIEGDNLDAFAWADDFVEGF
ncbi:MAG: hypothetical protein WCI60_04870, partial [bacterium]